MSARRGLSSTEKAVSVALIALVESRTIHSHQAHAVVNAIAFEAGRANLGFSRADVTAALSRAFAPGAPAATPDGPKRPATCPDRLEGR